MLKSISDCIEKVHLISSTSFTIIQGILMFLEDYNLQLLCQETQIIALMKLISKIFFLTTHEMRQKTITIYEKFVSKLSELRYFECNNFASMLYNMKSYLLLNNTQDIKNTKSILKKAIKYSQQRTNCDISLLAINQNNLAVLYLQQEDYQKAFTYSLKAYENMKDHLMLLKKNKDQVLKSKVAIFVNSCYLIKQSLNGRMIIEEPDQKTKKQYLQYMELFHSQGYKKAKKYLGTDSYLFKLMQKRHVPINDQYFRKDLIWKYQLSLVSISHSDLARQKLQKMVDYLNEKVNPRLDSLLNSIIKFQQHRKNIPSPPLPLPPPEPLPTPPPSPKLEPQAQTILLMTKHFLNSRKFSIKIKILKGKTHKLGKTLIQIIQSQKVVASTIIQQDLLQLIVCQLSIDSAPYDLNIKGCSPQQFAQYFLLPNIYLQQNQVSIQPRCKGLFHERKVTFFGYQCYVFVNHIKANEFRICISPFQMAQTFHISVVINETMMDQIIKDYCQNFIIDPKIQNLLKVCKGQDVNEVSVEQIILSEHKFINTQLLENQIPFIISGFQKFITDHKFAPSNLKYLFKHKHKTFLYFKYKMQQLRTGKGCFYGIRNLQKDKTIDVVLENRHQTYCPTGKIRAKGYHCVQYSYLHFQLGMQEFNKYQFQQIIQAFAMVSDMYHLYTYQYELQRDQKELYGQNAIRIGKLIGRTGKRVSTLIEDTYPTTITAQIVTINNELPLGVKVNIWNEETCSEQGFFLRLDKRRWLKQKPKDLNNSLKQSKMSSNRSSTSLFSNRKVKQQPPALLNFLFNPILTTLGFDMLIKQLKYYSDKKYYGIAETPGNPKFGKLQDFLPLSVAKQLYQQYHSKKANSILSPPKGEDIQQQSQNVL